MLIEQLESRNLYAQATVLEQKMVDLINESRANPVAAMQQLNMDLNEGLPPGSITTNPKCKLVWSSQLNDAARKFSLEILSRGYLSHTGIDGSDPNTRITREGYVANISLENAGVTASPAIYWDPIGVVTRQHLCYLSHAGHRIQELYYKTSNIGVGISIGNFGLGGSYSLCSVIEFANPVSRPPQRELFRPFPLDPPTSLE